MDCENSDSCLFYCDEIPDDKGLGHLQKVKYCEGNKTLCARYIVAYSIGNENVPTDMIPNMIARAKKIIEEHYLNKNEIIAVSSNMMDIIFPSQTGIESTYE